MDQEGSGLFPNPLTPLVKGASLSGAAIRMLARRWDNGAGLMKGEDQKSEAVVAADGLQSNF